MVAHTGCSQKLFSKSIIFPGFRIENVLFPEAKW